jgi:flagellin-like protein
MEKKENKQNMFNFRKLRKNVKAISPVISVLLMIAVAVVASLVAYAWVMGYIGGQTQKTGEAIQIQSVSGSIGGTTLTVYVQNIGQGTAKLVDDQCLYINGALVASTPTASTGFDTTTGNLQEKSTAILVNTAPLTAIKAGDSFVIKVTVADGTWSQITKVF